MLALALVTAGAIVQLRLNHIHPFSSARATVASVLVEDGRRISFDWPYRPSVPGVAAPLLLVLFAAEAVNKRHQVLKIINS